MPRQLPDFTVDAYREFLRAVQEAGYALRPVREMPDWDGGRTVYLRHDVDVHIPGIERVAAAERELGASATYGATVVGNPGRDMATYRAMQAQLKKLAAE